MFQGFYNLTSGMLTQTRKLNVISNNMANVTTPGFKSDTFTQRSFQDELMYRTGNLHKNDPQPIGTMNWKVVADGNVTNYSGGGFSTTVNPARWILASSVMDLSGENGRRHGLHA